MGDGYEFNTSDFSVQVAAGAIPVYIDTHSLQTRSLRSDPDQFYQDGAGARTCKPVAYGNMAQTRARGLNTHVELEAGVLIGCKQNATST